MARIMRPVRASAAIEAKYTNKLFALLKKERQALNSMAVDVFKQLEKDAGQEVVARMLDKKPVLAMDATPPEVLIEAFRARYLEWADGFDRQGVELAEWFGTQTTEHATFAFAQSLASATGHTVQLQISPAIEQALTQVVADNVALIKSLKDQYAEQMLDEVLKSVASGRDLQSLQQALVTRFEVSESRAALIARDQNNKATSFIDRSRKLEVGITTSVWMHSGGSVNPRLSHLAAHGLEYDTATGMWLDGEYTHPGEQINCGCTSAGKLPAYGDWKPESDVSQFFTLENS